MDTTGQGFRGGTSFEHSLVQTRRDESRLHVRERLYSVSRKLSAREGPDWKTAGITVDRFSGR